MGEDCPVFDNLFEFCQIYAGGTIGELHVSTSPTNDLQRMSVPCDEVFITDSDKVPIGDLLEENSEFVKALEGYSARN